MLKYFINDMTHALQYYPIGLLAGGILLLVLWLRNERRRKQGKDITRVWPYACFYAYLVVVVVITLLSRESGQGKALDLTLFSTLHINARNDAYVLENIILFVPYGFTMMWAQRPERNRIWLMFKCLVNCTLTSLMVETIQLISGRGCFQVDDIWTNALGGFIGILLFAFFIKRKNH